MQETRNDPFFTEADMFSMVPSARAEKVARQRVTQNVEDFVDIFSDIQ